MVDRISTLPKDVLLKILTFLPAKEAVSTSVVSKQWNSLWKLMPRFSYSDPMIGNNSGAFRRYRTIRFIDKFLLLHKRPVLETLHLLLGQYIPPPDIELWIRIAVSRAILHLLILRVHPGLAGPIRLPLSLYTCESLVTLHLQTEVNVEEVPLRICFHSLKTLILMFVQFSGDELVRSFLAGCPVLSDLRVLRCTNDTVQTFTISVPTLERLTIIDWMRNTQIPSAAAGFVLNVPSLKSLMIANEYSWRYSWVNIPCLVKADIKLKQGDDYKFYGYFASAKEVSLCLKASKEPHRIGGFSQVLCLNLCLCSLDWFRHIIGHAPQLSVLRFEPRDVRMCGNLNPLQRCRTRSENIQTQLEQPDSVPQCLLSCLEKVDWLEYKGNEAEKKVLVYLLENAAQLKTMKMRSLRPRYPEEMQEMMQEILSIKRRSTKCRILFT